MTLAQLYGLVRRRPLGRRLSQARRVERPARYLLDELRTGPDVGEYRLRRGGTAVLRRRGSDRTMFDEIFCARVYEPPPHVAEALDALGRPPGVLDLGANIGLFGLYARARWPGARVVSVEADPANAAVLQRAARLNPASPPWDVRHAAASNAGGSVRFVTGQGAESHQAHPSEADAVELAAIDVLPMMGEADLVKIDIEGGEWPILADPRLAEVGARALVLEHHGRGCPSCEPRRTATELLHAAGFEVLAGGPQTLGVGVLWGWR